MEVLALIYTILLIGLFVVLGVCVERKLAGFFQDRYGPMEVGYKGLLQTVADGIKLLQKEEIIPTAADKWFFLAAPVIIFIATFLGFAILPYAQAFQGAAIETGIFFFMAIVSLDVIGFLMAGWSSNNKYSILGSWRAVSQIISYEVPLGLTILAVVMISQTMNLQTMSIEQGIFAQSKNYLFGIAATGIETTKIGGFLTWNIVRAPILIPSFLIYFIATLAQANRAPFDIAEAESEIIAGFQTEYAGFRCSVIMLREYEMMLLTGLLGSVLFFGGWNSPLANIGSFALADWTSGVPEQISGYAWGLFWFMLKGFVWVFVQIWVRWTYPRLRVDQLMYLCWKILTPASILLVFLAAVWRMLMI